MLVVKFSFHVLCVFSGSWSQPSKYRWVPFYSTTSWLDTTNSEQHHFHFLVPMWSNGQTCWPPFASVTVHLSHFYVKVSTAVWTECCHNIKTIVAQGWIVSSVFFRLWSEEKEIDKMKLKNTLLKACREIWIEWESAQCLSMLVYFWYYKIGSRFDENFLKL